MKKFMAGVLSLGLVFSSVAGSVSFADVTLKKVREPESSSVTLEDRTLSRVQAPSLTDVVVTANEVIEKEITEEGKTVAENKTIAEEIPADSKVVTENKAIAKEKQPESKVAESDVILVSTEEDLRLIKDNSNQKIILQKDIVLSGSTKNWTPIKNFKGMFDGNGHTISNLIIDEEKGAAFFQSITETAVIKNLTIEGAVSSKSSAAGIACVNAGRIKNCVNKARIFGSKFVGGIASSLVKKAVIENCTNYGEINGFEDIEDEFNLNVSCGGIVGEICDSLSVVKGCKNEANICGCSCVAGIVGQIESLSTCNIIENCENCGDIKGRDLTAGIVGSISEGNRNSVKSCQNKGNICASKFFGGIVGAVVDNNDRTLTYLTKCTNEGRCMRNGTIDVTSTHGIIEKDFYKDKLVMDGCKSLNILEKDLKITGEKAIAAAIAGTTMVKKGVVKAAPVVGRSTAKVVSTAAKGALIAGKGAIAATPTVAKVVFTTAKGALKVLRIAGEGIIAVTPPIAKGALAVSKTMFRVGGYVIKSLFNLAEKKFSPYNYYCKIASKMDCCVAKYDDGSIYFISKDGHYKVRCDV